MKNMIKTIFVSVFLCFIVFSFLSEAFAGPPRRHKPYKKRRYLHVPPARRPVSPGSKYRWIRRYKHQSGAYIGGYWRPPCGVGFSWVDGYWDAEGAWVFGNCNPAKLRKNYMWAPGYWDSSVWIKGYWRPRKKAGFAWAPGHYNNKGIWIKGHWRK